MYSKTYLERCGQMSRKIWKFCLFIILKGINVSLRPALSQAATKIKLLPSENACTSPTRNYLRMSGKLHKMPIWVKKHETNSHQQRKEGEKYEASKTKITAGNTEIARKGPLRVILCARHTTLIPFMVIPRKWGSLRWGLPKFGFTVKIIKNAKTESYTTQ